ncbi:MAG TPA: PTS system mannose/fructose/sorbose family transporter subunit IID [Gemmatimonadota bacterium]|nr:PTS system mannose/fructose/sorbose family transporter subunit IID [Gemmatimonadota bacterium]
MTGASHRPTPGDRRRIAWRSGLLQSVWNYETLQAVGFAWALLPGLDRLYPDREARSRRLAAHLEIFNSNPYLASLGLGVALRLEAEVARGAAGAERRLERLLRALRGTLGALGDQLFWAGWRPALGLAAVVAVLGTGSPWVAAVYLLAYNTLAQTVRARGVDAGYASGAGIARVLQDPFWRRATEACRTAGAFAAGAALGAGATWALAGGVRGAGVFSLSLVLLWLAGARAGSRGGRVLSPPLAFLLILALLSAIVHFTDGASG